MLNNGGWTTEEVARGQRDLVERELALDPWKVAPYGAFLRALVNVGPRPGWRLLDAGCGVGHYGTLMRKWCPQYEIGYHGADSSQAMIDVARVREPGLSFECRALDELPYANFQLTLISSAVECTDKPLWNLSRVLTDSPGFVIWNRIRTSGLTGFISEATYAGHLGRIWLWHPDDLVGLLRLSGRRYSLNHWHDDPNSLTVVIWPKTAPVVAG